MEATMPTYIKALSKNDYDVFGNIIEKKYREFRLLYFSIKNYSDEISDLTYSDSDTGLSVIITVTDGYGKTIISELKKTIIDDSHIDISRKKDNIFITITRND